MVYWPLLIDPGVNLETRRLGHCKLVLVDVMQVAAAEFGQLRHGADGTATPGAYMQLHIAATPGSGVMNHANYCAIMAMIFGAPSNENQLLKP